MSDLYQRRRRLAVVIAVISAFLLAAWLGLGSLPEAYSHPALLATDRALYVVHRAGRDPEPVPYLIELDPATLALRSRRWFFGPDLVCVATRDDVIGFFGQTYRTLTSEGRLERLDQDWPVLAAARDPATETIWLFGVRERSIVARRLRAGVAEPPEAVADAGAGIERMAATFAPEGGATVVWKEKDRPGLRSARRGAERFAPLADFETGESLHWATLQLGARQIVLWFDRAEAGWSSTLKLKASCCRTCGLRPPDGTWTFRDDFHFMARRVTGLAAAPEGDRIRLLFTRVTLLETVTVPAETLAPEPAAALAAIHLEAPWSRYLNTVVPVALLVFAFSLVYLGFMLFRERRRALAGALGLPIASDLHADVMQRMMAFLIDQMVLLPVHLLVAQYVPNTPDMRWSDPAVLGALGLLYLVSLVYFTVQEAWTGQTIGKRLVGIRVTEVGSERLRPGRAVVRNLLRPLDEFCALGVFAILLTRRRQRLGDLVAGTTVVQAEPDKRNQA